MGSIENSEDPDEILHSAAFYQSALFANLKKYKVSLWMSPFNFGNV